jgi:hypothetical protein
VDTPTQDKVALPEPEPERERLPGRPWLTPWKKGQSGNPAGHTAKLESYIKKCTLSGTELVDFLLDVLRGSHPGLKGMQAKHRIAWQFRAIDKLLDRGWGKPKISAEISTTNTERQEIQFSAVLTTLPPDVLTALLSAVRSQLPTPTPTPLLQDVSHHDTIEPADSTDT